jgi:polyferredoxin
VPKQGFDVNTDPIASDALGIALLDYLRVKGSEVECASGTGILHEGEPGVAVYFILAGEAEVSLQAADGRHLTLCRLGPGEYFGELSVLRNEPVSADVTSMTPMRLLRYPAELFPTALAECEPLRAKLLGHLAQDLKRSTSEVWELFQRQEAFSELVRTEVVEDSMVAVFPRMRLIRQQLMRLGKGDGAVLLTGAPGTGKTLSAHLIHHCRGDPERALLVVDCTTLPAGRASSAIFGFCEGEDFPGQASGFGAIHIAHEGDLILQHIGTLPARTQAHLADYLDRTRRGDMADFPKVRILATAHDLENPLYADEVIEPLRRAFSNTIRLPPLIERPREIVHLARHFLSEIDGHKSLRLSRGAEHALVSLNYSVRNVDELRDIVAMAARCSVGGEIRAEHVFTGPGEEEPIGLSLGRPSPVLRFLETGGLRWVRWATLLSFLAVIVLCLVAGATLAGRLANGFIWTVWEPAVFAVFLLGGALWCTVCPLSSAARMAKGAIGRERPPPKWIGNPFVAAVLPILGFLAILWVEQVFHMTEVPLGSGFLLLALILAAVVFAVIYEREVWCRHVCPLGRLAVVLAPAAPLAVAADRHLCASTCTTHDCYQGRDGIPGCTVFRHPMNSSEAHQCKLCGDCLRTCPHDSTHLMLRPPGMGALGLSGVGRYPATFALSLLLLAPLFLVALSNAWLQQPAVLAAAGLAAILVGLVLAWRLPGVLGVLRENPLAATRVAAALAVLAWGPLMAAQFRNIPVLHELRIQPSGSTAWLGPFEDGVSVLTLASVAAVLLAATISAAILWASRRRCENESQPIARSAWRGLTLVWAVSLVVFLVLAI